MNKWGFNIKENFRNKTFKYGSKTFGPKVEQRNLNDIRQSLLEPKSDGPEVPYIIAMDVGNICDKDDLINRNLLYGACIYSKGQIGNEPVRSQGHIHGISKSVNSSTPELYQIIRGKACIYMQESAKDNPGRCFAIIAKSGDIVLVPPGWAHSTINLNTKKIMSFGAWCVRDYCFDYKDVRRHKGLAYYPILEKNKVSFIKNKLYKAGDLVIKKPREYKEFNIKLKKPIYKQYTIDNGKFDFIKDPRKIDWKNFIP